MRPSLLPLVLFVIPTVASAADKIGALPRPASMGAPAVLSELRVGVFAHDPAGREIGGADVNVEALFVKPFLPADPVLAFLVPRLHLGATVNTAGRTSQAYAGLTWSYDITSRLFAEISFGVATHNGEAGRIVPHDRAALGCRALFRESASVGYRLDRSWSVMATVEHVSNANLCNDNHGLTNYGARLSYAF